jgi:hypothetical protein
MIKITVTETVTVTRTVTVTVPVPAPVVEPALEDGTCPDCGWEMTDCCSDPMCGRYFCEYCEFGPGR